MASSSASLAPLKGGRADRFGGLSVAIGAGSAPDPQAFQEKLRDSISAWRAAGVRGLWLRVMTEDADLLPVVLAEGFQVHHAKPDYVQLNMWLPDPDGPDSVNRLPPFAHTYIGVGGIVVNSKDELLVVTERYAFDDKPRWKLPGGLVDPGEAIHDAAVREVREETGVVAEFESVACFRFNPSYINGCEDIYFACRLKATSDAIHKDDAEISAARWMPVEEFLADGNVYPVNHAIVRSALRVAPDTAVLHSPLSFQFHGRTLELDLYSPGAALGSDGGDSRSPVPSATAVSRAERRREIARRREERAQRRGLKSDTTPTEIDSSSKIHWFAAGAVIGACVAAAGALATIRRTSARL